MKKPSSRRSQSWGRQTGEGLADNDCHRRGIWSVAVVRGIAGREPAGRAGTKERADPSGQSTESHMMCQHPSSTVFVIFPLPVTPHPPLPRLPTPHPTSTSSSCVPPAAPAPRHSPAPICQWALHAGFCPAQIHHPLPLPILPAPLQEGLTLLRGTPILSLGQCPGTEFSLCITPPLLDRKPLTGWV